MQAFLRSNEYKTACYFAACDTTLRRWGSAGAGMTAGDSRSNDVAQVAKASNSAFANNAGVANKPDGLVANDGKSS